MIRFVSALLACLPFLAVAQDNYAFRIDCLLNYLEAEDAFSGEIILQKNNTVLYHRKVGQLAEQSDLFRVGSVSKVYTASVIYQLIEEGKLHYDDHLSLYYPSVKYADDITIDMLLSHSSGIYNFTEMDNYYDVRSEEFSKARMLATIAKHKPAFKPGKDCSYSNSNYIILGYIIEDITGKSLNQNIQERICAPLGLTHTYLEEDLSRYLERNTSYVFDGAEWQRDAETHPSIPGGAGAMVVSIDEMAKFDEALFQGKVINESSLAHMKTLRYRSVGHGIFKAPFFEKEGWGHTGRVDEFRSFLGYMPADSLVFCVVSNSMNMNLNDVLIGVLSAYYSRVYEFPTFIKCDLTEPNRDLFVGEYKLKLLGITMTRFQITQAGGNALFMNEKSKPSEKALMMREDGHTYYMSDNGGRVIFEMPEKGRVRRAYLKQGKLKLKCKKVK